MFTDLFILKSDNLNNKMSNKLLKSTQSQKNSHITKRSPKKNPNPTLTVMMMTVQWKDASEQAPGTSVPYTRIPLPSYYKGLGNQLDGFFTFDFLKIDVHMVPPFFRCASISRSTLRHWHADSWFLKPPHLDIYSFPSDQTFIKRIKHL